MSNKQIFTWIFILLLSGLIGCFPFTSFNNNNPKCKAILTGYVFDSNKSPMFGVSVFLRNTSYGAITDSNGHYQINRVPYSHHLLRYSAVYYKTIEDSIFITVDSIYISDTIFLTKDPQNEKVIY